MLPSFTTSVRIYKRRLLKLDKIRYLTKKPYFDTPLSMNVE